MGPFQIYVNGEKYGLWRWTLHYVQDLVLELSQTNKEVYVLIVSTNQKIYQHPNPFAKIERKQRGE